MRPLELEMTAFGSYAEKVMVPFAQLHRGLYLVAGDTGAGKTTIFDAVVFALYGRASGRDRSPAMLHSDYVEKSTDTVVKLCFEEGGKEYTVHRSIHFPKKRGTDSGYGDQQISALLEEPDREPTEGADKVTKRIEELLGLNAEQFRKIVMLAQGEFREFLKADSDKKNEILGKLFDNSEYLRYQNLLSGARDELARRRSERQEQLQLLMHNVFLQPEGLEPEQAEGFLPGHPALLENLLALTKEEQNRMDAQTALEESLRRRISELDSRKGAALELNARFDALKRLEQEQKLLEGRREEMRLRRERLERAERAYHKVRPFLEERDRTARVMLQSREELRLQQLETERREKDLALALEEGQKNEEKQTRVQELALLLQRTEEEIRRLGELEETRKALTLLLQEKDRTLAQEAEAARRGTETEAKLEKLRERLEELEGSEALVLQRRGQWEQCKRREESLLALQRDCDSIGRETQELEQEEERLTRLTEDALAAEERHHRLYSAFLAGQAGIMASQLRQEIAEFGHARCPVCGSRVTGGQESAFASGGAHIPDQDQVDRARASLERAEKARAEQDKRREALTARITSHRDAALIAARKLLPDCESWEALQEAGLDRLLREEGLQKEEAEKALREAEMLDRERLTLRQAEPGLEQEKKQAAEALERLRASLQELRTGEESLKTLERERAAGLHYASAKEAREAGQRTLREQEELRTMLERSQKRLEETRTLRDTALGGLREKEKLTRERNEAADEAGKKLSAALEENGFADTEAVRAVLSPAGGSDPAAWLRMEQKTIGDWEAALLHKGEELRQQRESLAGREPVDTALLEEQLRAENDALSRCGGEKTRLENLLLNHRQVLERATEAKRDLAASDRSWKRLERLGSLAVGMNSDSGKLSFDRYAMGAVFREILEMANRRMDTMSGGRYQLIHRSSADRRNAKAGLEIQVLDLSTGQMRGSESLSGGEGFFTSLALALGLADVVQNRAGGRNLDALFIDEGFGSLSGGVLDKALEVLGQLSEGKRLVGIISHVEQLEECIPQKIRVESGEKGSSLRIEGA